MAEHVILYEYIPSNNFFEKLFGVSQVFAWKDRHEERQTWRRLHDTVTGFRDK
jgi:hypothetical protein